MFSKICSWEVMQLKFRNSDNIIHFGLLCSTPRIVNDNYFVLDVYCPDVNMNDSGDKVVRILCMATGRQTKYEYSSGVLGTSSTHRSMRLSINRIQTSDVILLPAGNTLSYYHNSYEMIDIEAGYLYMITKHADGYTTIFPISNMSEAVLQDNTYVTTKDIRIKGMEYSLKEMVPIVKLFNTIAPYIVTHDASVQEGSPNITDGRGVVKQYDFIGEKGSLNAAIENLANLKLYVDRCWDEIQDNNADIADIYEEISIVQSDISDIVVTLQHKLDKNTDGSINVTEVTIPFTTSSGGTVMLTMSSIYSKLLDSQLIQSDILLDIENIKNVINNLNEGTVDTSEVISNIQSKIADMEIELEAVRDITSQSWDDVVRYDANNSISCNDLVFSGAPISILKSDGSYLNLTNTASLKSVVETIAGTLVSLKTAISTKANSSDLTAIQNQVDTALSNMQVVMNNVGTAVSAANSAATKANQAASSVNSHVADTGIHLSETQKAYLDLVMDPTTVFVVKD